MLFMKKNALIQGTLILTAAGFLSRIIGFFYRIFLSRMFGAEGMGIYELINPVLSLTFALCTSGIQSAVSKYVAAQPENNGTAGRLRYLLAGLTISGTLSMLCALFVYQNADFIAIKLLSESRCAPLLRITALSFFAACIHSCINGYFYGIKKAGLPAFCQLFEQTCRVGSVFLFWSYAQQHQITFSITVAAVGLVIGEFSSMLAAIPITLIHFYKKRKSPVFAVTGIGASIASVSYRSALSQIILFALPLSANRVCLHLLSAAESARIPVSLQKYGYSSSEAISIYGVFTGMAMTCILFPSALTNSVSVLLMPLIAEADAAHNLPAIRRAILKCIQSCLALGFLCLAFFGLTGNFIGSVLFHNELAGQFIRTLSFICPFLYLNTTLFSILNGLGKTGHTFLINMAALILRIAFVWAAIPIFGMKGFFWGILAAQFLTTACCFLTLRRFLYYNG
ncbi:MAG: polysaccharide biosynthesis protein [Lachnospiraceae bacterium]|nr:polysaccharide biosynthesis protein [Lachnospiraceae bacterium]